jgi:hypothetical protein
MPAEPGEICRPEIIAAFRSLMIFAGTMLAIVSKHRVSCRMMEVIHEHSRDTNCRPLSLTPRLQRVPAGFAKRGLISASSRSGS